MRAAARRLTAPFDRYGADCNGGMEQRDTRPPERNEHGVSEHEQLVSHLQLKTQELRALYDAVRRCEQEVRDARAAVQRTCDHTWVRDDSDRGHRTRYECTKCYKLR